MGAAKTFFGSCEDPTTLGGFDRNAYAVVPAPATRLIEDGDTLEFGNRHFEYIHSPRSIAL